MGILDVLGIQKYLSAGLGALLLLALIFGGVQSCRVHESGLKLDAAKAALKAETATCLACATDLKGLQREVDEANAQIDEWKKKADAAVAAQAEADRMARDLDAARERLAAVDVQRERLRAQLAGLPLCEKYRVTLVALSGGEP